MCDDGWGNCWIAVRCSQQSSTFATLIYSIHNPHTAHLYEPLVFDTELLYFILFHCFKRDEAGIS